MLVVDKFKDRDPVIDLQPEAVEQVVNDDHVFEVTVLDDTQVFDEEAILRLHAVFSRQDVTDVLIFWVNVVDDGICVVLRAGGEDDDLVFLTHVREELHQIGSYLDRNLTKMSSHLSKYLPYRSHTHF